MLLLLLLGVARGRRAPAPPAPPDARAAAAVALAAAAAHRRRHRLRRHVERAWVRQAGRRRGRDDGGLHRRRGEQRLPTVTTTTTTTTKPARAQSGRRAAAPEPQRGPQRRRRDRGRAPQGHVRDDRREHGHAAPEREAVPKGLRLERRQQAPALPEGVALRPAVLLAGGLAQARRRGVDDGERPAALLERLGRELARAAQRGRDVLARVQGVRLGLQGALAQRKVLAPEQRVARRQGARLLGALRAHAAREQLLLERVAVLLVLRDGLRDALRELVAVCLRWFGGRRRRAGVCVCVCERERERGGEGQRAAVDALATRRRRRENARQQLNVSCSSAAIFRSSIMRRMTLRPSCTRPSTMAACARPSGVVASVARSAAKPSARSRPSLDSSALRCVSSGPSGTPWWC